MSKAVGEAAYYTVGQNGSVICRLCPHACKLQEGGTGLCRVRRNEGGIMVLPFWGQVSGTAIDPIEKKPLYHFLPHTGTFSVGYVSCNLRCPFCQNYHISQTAECGVRFYTPEALVAEALSSGCPSISHTYSEPLVHTEFVRDCCRIAREKGLASILVTNGCVSQEPARDVLVYTDAVNVDLKAWDAAWYNEELGGERDTVCAFIRTAVELGVHVEVTTLVVPGKNDSDGDIDAIASFLAGLDREIPYHLSAYRPMYKYSVPPTPS